VPRLPGHRAISGYQDTGVGRGLYRYEMNPVSGTGLVARAVLTVTERVEAEQVSGQTHPRSTFEQRGGGRPRGGVSGLSWRGRGPRRGMLPGWRTRDRAVWLC
jgi:hypothetical protein